MRWFARPGVTAGRRSCRLPALRCDSLVRLLGDRDDREELYASRRMTAIDTAWEWLDELFRGPGREQGGAVMKWIAF